MRYKGTHGNIVWVIDQEVLKCDTFLFFLSLLRGYMKCDMFLFTPGTPLMERRGHRDGFILILLILHEAKYENLPIQSRERERGSQKRVEAEAMYRLCLPI